MSRDCILPCKISCPGQARGGTLTDARKLGISAKSLRMNSCMSVQDVHSEGEENERAYSETLGKTAQEGAAEEDGERAQSRLTGGRTAEGRKQGQTDTGAQ